MLCFASGQPCMPVCPSSAPPPSSHGRRSPSPLLLASPIALPQATVSDAYVVRVAESGVTLLVPQHGCEGGTSCERRLFTPLAVDRCRSTASKATHTSPPRAAPAPSATTRSGRSCLRAGAASVCSTACGCASSSALGKRAASFRASGGSSGAHLRRARPAQQAAPRSRHRRAEAAEGRGRRSSADGLPGGGGGDPAGRTEAGRRQEGSAAEVEGQPEVGPQATRGVPRPAELTERSRNLNCRANDRLSVDYRSICTARTRAGPRHQHSAAPISLF